MAGLDFGGFNPVQLAMKGVRGAGRMAGNYMGLNMNDIPEMVDTEDYILQDDMPRAKLGRNTSEDDVLARFGGSTKKYNEWWNSLPKDQRPTNWGQAMQVLDKPATLLSMSKTSKPSVNMRDRLDMELASIGNPDAVRPNPIKLPSLQEQLDTIGSSNSYEESYPQGTSYVGPSIEEMLGYPMSGTQIRGYRG
jgi:hypothetical protein